MSKVKKITITMDEFHKYLDKMYNAGFNSGFFSGIQAYAKRIDNFQKDVLSDVNNAMRNDTNYKEFQETFLGEILNVNKGEDDGN